MSFQANLLTRSCRKTCFPILPKEILTDSECLQLNERLDVVRANLIPRLKCYNDGAFTVEKATEAIKEQYKTSFTEVFNLKTHKTALRASGALLSYLNETQKGICPISNRLNLLKTANLCRLMSILAQFGACEQRQREQKRKGASYGCLTTQKRVWAADFVRLGRASASKSEKDSKTA